MDTNALSQCNIGIQMEDGCHKLTYCRKQGFRKFSSFGNEDKAIIQWRSGVQLDEEDSVCFHHEQLLLKRYESLQRYCVDPRNVHSRKIFRSLRCISEDVAKELGLIPGQKLCSNCWIDLKGIDVETEADHQTDEEAGPSTPLLDPEAFESAASLRDDLNTTATILGCSPIKYVSPKDKAGYLKNKAKKMKGAVQEKLCHLMDISMEMDTDTDGTGNCTKCSDFDKLVDLLIEKCKVSSRKEKIQLLTLVPDSWSKQKTQEIFGVSEYLVRREKNYSLGPQDPKKKMNAGSPYNM